MREVACPPRRAPLQYTRAPGPRERPRARRSGMQKRSRVRLMRADSFTSKPIYSEMTLVGNAQASALANEWPNTPFFFCHPFERQHAIGVHWIWCISVRDKYLSDRPWAGERLPSVTLLKAYLPLHNHRRVSPQRIKDTPIHFH